MLNGIAKSATNTRSGRIAIINEVAPSPLLMKVRGDPLPDVSRFKGRLIISRLRMQIIHHSILGISCSMRAGILEDRGFLSAHQNISAKEYNLGVE
ncbi:MAG: hypothetical protein WC586_13185 [Methanoregula sp.]